MQKTALGHAIRIYIGTLLAENIFLKNSSLVTFLRNILDISRIYCDELTSQLVTPRPDIIV